MLTPEQLDIFGDELAEIYQRLEQEVIDDIARRVRKSVRWTETAELQAQFLRDLGYSPYRIRTEVLRKLRADPAYIKWVEQNTLESKAKQQIAIDAAKEELKRLAPELYETAGNMSWNNDLSMWKQAGKTLRRGGSVDRAIREMEKRGRGELLNLTKTTGFAYPTGPVSSRRAFTAALNDALTKTVSGAFSHQSALDAAVRQLTMSGLRTIDFKRGVSRQIDTAARTALRTSLGQMSGRIMQANIESSNVEYVQVSAHWGARPSHAAWQGKVYSMEDFKRICGYDDPSNPDSIYSYNCRHDHYPHWPGISVPVEYPPEPEPVTIHGRTYTYYQATQKQRNMEREIHALKREVNAGGDKAVLGSQIIQKTKEYRSFSWATNIRPKLERLSVLGYDKSTAASVSAAYRNSFAIARSLGAKAKNYDVLLPSGEYVRFTEGERVTKVRVIAGKGRKRQIDELSILVERYGGEPSNWQKKKGIGYLDYHGESYRAEVHWYEEKNVGKVKFKAHAKNGEWILDD